MSELLDALDQPHVQLLLRLVLGGLLVLAGVTKLTDRLAFRQAVAEYQVLPAALERPFAMALPYIEVVLGALLLLGLGTTAVAALAAPLFASFGIAIGINLARGRSFNCHCFGSVQSDPIGWGALLRSLALVIAAVVVAAGASRFGALDALLFGAHGLPPASEVIPIVFVAAVVLDLLVLLPETLSFLDTLSRARTPHRHHHANGRSAT
jgi:uncharacterized membrane protein YphA (DoxX/SURF4 family)